jgi:uncharacterized repeat protein (TIGR01451 family)
MGQIQRGNLRRLALVMSLAALAALAIAGATSARVASKPDVVTFCHVAGRGEDPANTVTLTLPYGAAFGQAGHFNEDGTPNAGHEQDHLGACSPEPPPDVCPNIEGDQAAIPEGLVKDEHGDCVEPSPPPTGDTVEHLVVTKTAGTSWNKFYNWDVEKSVDKSQLDLKPGETGSVVWKVDVTQTGWTAQDMIVYGTITVANPNDTAVTGVVLTDEVPDTSIYCGVHDFADLTLPANGSVTCKYSAPLGSTQGGTNTATAVGSLNGVDVSDTGTADFMFSERPNYEFNKTVKAVDGDNTWSEISGTTSFTYDEQFSCPGQGRTNVVDLFGDDPSTWDAETDHELDTDSASVTVGCSSNPPPPPPTVQTPPPPPPPPPSPPTVKTDEFMDVQVIKDATPQVQLVNGQADIAYAVRVRNNGPNQAHNVLLSDAAPGGVTFLAVTQQPVGGNCSVSAALLSCTLGTLGPGVERSIGLSGRVTQTGTYVNSATGTGEGKDTNGANNTDDASTLVTAPVTPPTTTPTTPKPPVKPKPRPKPAVDICRVLKVTPGMVKANGKRYVVLAKVTRSKNPVQGVEVRFSALGLDKVVRTNKQGVARLGVTPSKAGIMLVKIASAKACNTARIGVVGVFQPPVTG